MKFTLGDARSEEWGIPLVLDLCPTDDRVRHVVNQAQYRLITRGKWWGLYQKIKICLTTSGCVTWPRQVAGLENIAVCGEPIMARNEWFEFLQDGPGLVPRRGVCNTCCSTDLGWPTRQMFGRGVAPSFNDVHPPNKKLRLYATVPEDYGKRVLVKGFDGNGGWIRTIEAGDYIDGFYMTLAAPFVDSAMEIKGITSYQKPITEGNVLAYEVDTLTSAQTQMGDFESDELIPSYRRSYISGISGSCSKTITAMAKLEFIPARNDNDILMIGNLAAIKDMVMAIKKRENNLEGEAIALEQAALRELNRELDHYSPTVQTAIRVNVFGSAKLSRKRIGSLT